MRILFAIVAAVLFVSIIPTSASAQVSQYFRSTDMLRDPRSGEWVNAQVFCRQVRSEDICQSVVADTQRFCNGARARDRAARNRDDRYDTGIDYRFRFGDYHNGVTVRGSVDPFASEYQGAQVSSATDIESCQDFRAQIRRIERAEGRTTGSGRGGRGTYAERRAQWERERAGQ